jgi:hypothetical protein
LREKKSSVEVGRTFQLDRKCCKVPNKNFFSTVYQRERGTIGRNNQKTFKKSCKKAVYYIKKVENVGQKHLHPHKMPFSSTFSPKID